MANSTELDTQIARLDPAVRDMLHEDLPGQLRTVHEALQADDLENAAKAVHVIHGSAAFCKLETLRLAARQLEDSLQNNQKNAELIGTFEDHLHEVLQRLKRETETRSD